MSNIITLDIDNATVKAVVNQIKSDMRGDRKYVTYVAEFNVTRESVKDHAAALAALVTPVTAQTKDGARTKYGNAVQAAASGLRKALPKSDEVKPQVLRISLSGEGGGSAVVPNDHPLYESILAMLAGE